jgi:nicotinamidase-related amidase
MNPDDERTARITDPSSTALILVDLQNDFCCDWGFYAAVGRDPEPLMRAVMGARRALEFARSVGMKVVHTRLEYPEYVGSIEQRHSLIPPGWSSREIRLRPGAEGTALVDEVSPQPGELVITKQDYSAFHDTALDSTLRRWGISQVVIGGVVTYACVQHTAFDAFARDYDVVVLRDATGGWIPDLHEAAHRIFELLIGPVLDVDDWIATAGSDLPESMAAERTRGK